MPLVSNSTRSNFPFTIDPLPTYTNGVGSNSSVDADTWNGLEAALYRVENHVQKTILFFDSADRHRVCLSGTATVSVSGTTTKQLVLLNFTAGQLAFLNGGVQRSGALILADAYGLTVSDDCTTDIILGVGVITVNIHRTDPTQFLSVGTYLVNLTILGY